jgi:hypothetical protein
MGLPVELQRLIWADVTENYYLRGSVIDRAATVLQSQISGYRVSKTRFVTEAPALNVGSMASMPAPTPTPSTVCVTET